MELLDENLFIDLIENQKLSSKQCFKREHFWCTGSFIPVSRYVRRFYSERSISSRASTEKVTEMVMEASSKVITAF